MTVWRRPVAQLLIALGLLPALLMACVTPVEDPIEVSIAQSNAPGQPVPAAEGVPAASSQMTVGDATSEAPADATTGTTAQLQAEPTPAPEIEWVDAGGLAVTAAGSEPLQPLALTPTAGTVQTVTVRQDGRQALFLIDNPSSDERVEVELIPMTVEMVFTVLGADPLGSTVSFDVVSAQVAEGEADLVADGSITVEGDPLLVQSSAALLRSMQGMNGVLNIDGQGRVISSELLIGDGADYESLVLGYVERNIMTLADPLPAQPLGVGARWQITSPALTEPFPATLVRSYEITEITDELVRANVTRAVRFSAGTFAETEIIAGSGLAGAGEAVWPRNGLLGVASYTIGGSISYGLGDTAITQELERTVAGQYELEVPAVVEPDVPVLEVPDPAASDPGEPEPGDPTSQIDAAETATDAAPEAGEGDG